MLKRFMDLLLPDYGTRQDSFREHVIKSTCDENVNQLTLGGGGSKAVQHYHRTKST